MRKTCQVCWMCEWLMAHNEERTQEALDEHGPDADQSNPEGLVVTDPKPRKGDYSEVLAALALVNK